MLIQSTLLALGLIGSLFLFLSLKQEIQTNTRKHRKQLEEMERQLRQAQSGPREESAPLPAPSFPVRPGFNLNKRMVAVRMLRRGQDLAHIAAALGVPRREVELLVRVQELTSPARS